MPHPSGFTSDSTPNLEPNPEVPRATYFVSLTLQEWVNVFEDQCRKLKELTTPSTEAGAGFHTSESPNFAKIGTIPVVGPLAENVLRVLSRAIDPARLDEKEAIREAREGLLWVTNQILGSPTKLERRPIEADPDVLPRTYGVRSLMDAMALTALRLQISLDLCTFKGKLEFENRVEHWKTELGIDPAIPLTASLMTELKIVAALPPRSHYRDLLDLNLGKISTLLEGVFPARLFPASGTTHPPAGGLNTALEPPAL